MRQRASLGGLEEFLSIATTFPTAIFTVLVLASLGYWMVGFLGLAGDHDGGDGDVGDADAGDAGDADAGDAGDADAGDADAGGHGHGHGHAEAAHTDDGGAFDSVMTVLGILKLRNAPLSVTLSILFLFSWLFAFFGTRYGMPLIPGPEALSGTLVSVGALIASVPFTSLITKPLKPLFKQNFAPGKRHLVGRVGVVRIGAGQKGTAQIKLKDPVGGEKGLLIRVATDDDLNSGDEVLLVDYDDEKKAYVAEPMEAVLPSKKSSS